MSVMMGNAGRNSRFAKFDFLISFFTDDEGRRKNDSMSRSKSLGLSLYIVFALLVVLMVAFLLIQNPRDALLHALMLRRLLLVSSLTHIIILLWIFLIYSGKQSGHFNTSDTVRERIELENMLNAIPVGVSITSHDDEGRILWCNEQMSEQLLEQVEMGQAVQDFEVSYVDAAGAVRYAAGSVSTIEYMGKYALLTMLRDVTAVRNAQRAAERSTDITILAGNIAHDFSHLLSMMKFQMYTGIRKLGVGHPAEMYFQQAAGSVKEVGQLVNKLRNPTSLSTADTTDGIVHNFNNLLTVMQLQLRLGMQKLDADHPAEQYFQQTAKIVKDAAELVKELYHAAVSEGMKVE